MKHQLLLTLITFCLVVMPRQADAQVHAVSATVRDCSSGYSCKLIETRGTCTCIGRTEAGEYLFLTAGHVLRDAVRVRIAIGGRWVNARPGSSVADENDDIGFIHARYAGELKRLAIADDVPAVGSPVQFSGLKRNRLDWEQSQLKPHDFAGDNITLTHQAVSGQSGGPVIFRGLIIGVISGNPRNMPGMLCSNCLGIRRFAERHNYRLRYRKPILSPLTPPPVQGDDPPSPTGQDARPAAGQGGAAAIHEAPPAPVDSPAVKPDQRLLQLQAENEKLKTELAGLESQRRKVEFRTFTGQKGAANVIVKRDGGTFVETLGPDGGVRDSDEYAAGEPIKFKVVELKEK